eukprot:COSAG01_NODE_33014_length_571_cov_1.419492_2_plen_65_part_01
MVRDRSRLSAKATALAQRTISIEEFETFCIEAGLGLNDPAAAAAAASSHRHNNNNAVVAMARQVF